MTDRAIPRLMAFLAGRASRLSILGLWSRAASFALTAVLMFSALFNIEAARVTRDGSDSARIAAVLNQRFDTARYSLAAEESLERKYRLEPSRDVLLRHAENAATFVSAMQAVRTLGGPADRALAEIVLRAHERYLAGTQRMFAAVRRRDAALVIAIDRGVIDPVFAGIEYAVRERADAHLQNANVALANLSDTQLRIIEITIAFSALGLFSQGAFLVVLLRYQRRLKANNLAELQKLAEAALTDNLTKIGNHRAYQVEFEREVSRAQRHGEMLSLAVMDVDDFKVVNDRNGHMHGDLVLITLAAMLRSLRAEDRGYRVGGDEFAVLLPHTSMGDATETMQRLRATAQRGLFGATISIGLATLTGRECDVETLQAQADAAMYAGKRGGRNTTTAFDSSMSGMWVLSSTKIHNLRQMIAAGSIRVVFQPIWDVEGRRVLAYEALARPDPQYGFDGPEEAFDLAERIGRAHELDAVCRKAAFASARDLPDGALLFMNVSPQSLDHGRLDPLVLLRDVRAAGLSAERVVIEITERSITRVDAVIKAAQVLQRYGFRLALDDTGAGNSGLEIMTRLSFEFVKIDRNVIVKAVHDKKARGVLAGIVAISQATDAYVIAEGIENAELLDFVCHIVGRQTTRRRSIHGVQGFLLQRPSDTFPTGKEYGDIATLLEEVTSDDIRAPAAAVEHSTSLALRP